MRIIGSFLVGPLFVGLSLTGWLFIVSFLTGCSSEPEEIIMSVSGPVPSSEMGITLTHEHVLVDFIGADSTGTHRWERNRVLKRALPFLEEARDRGLQTFIECTPAYIGRDPLLLKELSDSTGLNFLTNTGYYGARENRFLPSEFYDLTIVELSEKWIREFEDGIDSSGIRPGFIKIGVDANDTLSKDHVKIVSAAALTHNRTGLVIASHTGPDMPAFEQMGILESYGVVPSSFIWVHAQRGTIEGNIKAASEGAWISLDNINDRKKLGQTYSIDWYAGRISRLKEAGFLKNVLISHDAGWYSPGEKDGGNFRGYTAIFDLLIPSLKEHGFTERDIRQLLVVNPRKAFSLRKAL